MNLTLGHSNPPDNKGLKALNAERCLTLMAEGAALNMLDIDADTYKIFRSQISQLTTQIPDRRSDDEKLSQIRVIIKEFEGYRNNTESLLRGRISGWRTLSDNLFHELLARVGIDPASPSAAPLVSKMASLVTAEDLQSYQKSLTDFLHPIAEDGSILNIAAPLKVEDRTTDNDNAAGLRGGGSAVERLKSIMEHGGKGFIVLFRLGCLDIISERFGLEAVQDSLMAVSAFLTHCLHSDDAIYHWSDSTLLAILQGRISEPIVSAELHRIASRNRDITVIIDGRTIMLRIPLEFELTPIDRLHSANDLYKISAGHAAQW
jgi:hypothetical protein